MLRRPMLVFVAVLSGCIAMQTGEAEPVAGRADTFRFRMMPNAFVNDEAFVFTQLEPKLRAFQDERGYRAFEVADRMCQPMGACMYVVRFVR